MEALKERCRLAIALTVMMAASVIAGAGVPTTALAKEDWYTVGGVIYTIYEDAACTKVAGTLTTKDDGTTEQIELQAGTYYVVETAWPEAIDQDPNYTRDNPKVVVLEAGQEITVDSTDVARTCSIKLYKWDNEFDGTAQGDTSLSQGGEWRVRAYSQELFTTYDQCAAATADVDRQNVAMSVDGVEIDDLPFGTILVEETKAPYGYAMPDASQRYAIIQYKPNGDFNVVAGNDKAVASSSVDQDTNEITTHLGDTPLTGDITLDKKTVTGLAANGDTDMAGATFEIYNMSKGPVSVDGDQANSLADGTIPITGRDGWVATLVADKDGNASISGLPIGTYGIIETKTFTGGDLDEDRTKAKGEYDWIVSITANGNSTTTTQARVTSPTQKVTNRNETAPVTIYKIDEYLGDTPEGNASLIGAQFVVTNNSAAPMNVYDTTTKTWSVVPVGGTIETVTMKSLNGRAGARLAHRIQTACTIRYKETVAPQGYLLNSNTYELVLDERGNVIGEHVYDASGAQIS